MKDKKKITKIAAIFAIIFFLFMASAAQAVIKSNKAGEFIKNNSENQPLLYDDTYTWEDDFSNAQKIDMTYSDNYDVSGGKVSIEGIYPQWTDPSYTRMKVGTVQSSTSDSDVAIKITVSYDTDMRADYGDVRFKYETSSSFLEYWIEKKNPDPNNKYAIFWLKIPTLNSGSSSLYMFYGKPSATDQSDYWAVFDENSWVCEYAHDNRVTTHWYKEGAWDPDVSWGGGKFIVTWEEGTGYWPLQGTVFQQQIRAQYFDEDGGSISQRFDIVDEPDETPPFRYENPSSDYGGGNFFVAYEAYTNPLTNDHLDRDIEGAIVNTAQDGASSRFTICSASSIQADPCVTYDPNHNRFFVVWEDGRAGTNNYDLYGRFYKTSGSPDGSEFSLSAGTPGESRTQCEPWVAFNKVDNQYLVVWEESTNDPETGPFEIWGQVFTWQGGPIGGAKRISQQSSSSTDYNFPAVAYSELGEKFLVTWNLDDISSGDWNGPVYGRFLDKDGDFIDDIFTIANGQYCRTDVVPYLSTSFFVVYDNWAGSTGDIWGKMVNDDGSVNDYTIRLSDGDSDPADWPNVGSSGSKIFVAWEDTRVVYQSPFDGMPDVYANVWSLNTPGGSSVSVSFGDEKSLVLEAYIVSVKINPVNWHDWVNFDASKTGNVNFDILDGNNPSNVLMSGVSPGANIGSINSGSIRLKATFVRNNPSSSPTLDSWKVTYVGMDEEPPKTNLENIDGVKGLNEYYISEGVTIWLSAEDYPADTGSGVDKTYYTLNSGSSQIYNIETGIQLTVSQSSSWMGYWDVNFWSVDNNGNTENKNKPENKLTIDIDADRPECWITEPANEQQVEVPFYVRAEAIDNVGIERVEFDIEPFGEREGLPIKDTTPPYEWLCDVENKARIKAAVLADLDPGDPHPTDVNVMVRAQAFDKSGQTWIQEVWVCITNWEDSSNPWWLDLLEDIWQRLPNDSNSFAFRAIFYRLFRL